jgi:prophage tail gpP-like protein
MADNRVEVRVGGKKYGGWKSAVIEIGMDQLTRGFKLSVTDTFPGNVDFHRLRNGDQVRLFIGDDLICTGYIDHVNVTYSGTSITVTVDGKSKTVDLVDCCPVAKYGAIASKGDNAWTGVVVGKDGKKHEVPASSVQTTSWKNIKTSEIIASLAAPYGIAVHAAADIGERLSDHTIVPGEKVKESINRLITKDNLVVMDDEAGDLVIVEPGEAGDCADALELGKNILSGSANFDASKLYSRYVVLGQHAGTDTDFGRTAAEDKGIVDSQLVTRPRLLVIKDKGQSSKMTCGKRADFEKRYREAQYKSATYTVQGWRQSDGSLWKVNAMVRIVDRLLGIENNLLISKLSFSLSSQGMTTTLTVLGRDGYKRDGSSSDGEKKANPWVGVVK